MPHATVSAAARPSPASLPAEGSTAPTTRSPPVDAPGRLVAIGGVGVLGSDDGTAAPSYNRVVKEWDFDYAVMLINGDAAVELHAFSRPGAGSDAHHTAREESERRAYRGMDVEVWQRQVFDQKVHPGRDSRVVIYSRFIEGDEVDLQTGERKQRAYF